MTTDIQSQLDRLTNPQVAKEEEQARQRSNFRPPFTECVCDFGELTGPYTARLQNGTEYTAVSLKLLNMHSIAGPTPFTGTSFDLELRLPANPNPNAEVTLMVASAQKHEPAINSIRLLAGLRQVHIKERVHEYQGRRNNNGTWEDATLTTRFYEVLKIGGKAASNGHRTFSDEELEQAAKKINQLSSNEAMTALGDGAADILSRLILSGKVRQETGEDGEKRYVTVASF